MNHLQEALDAAVLAYRALQTAEARQALMDAMTEYHNDFLRREREEALSRDIERRKEPTPR